MSIHINPNPDQVNSLEALAHLNRQKIITAVVLVENANPTPLTPGELLQIIAGSDVTSDEAERIAEQAISLHGLMHSSGFEADEIVNALRTAISVSATPIPSWDDEFSDLLTRLITTSSVRAVSKAATLAYEHMHLFRSARLVTDVRPVFDEDAVDIDGAIISHDLRLEYFGRSGSSSLSVTLDTPDLLQLFHQCKRALTKANLTKQILVEGRPINATILGGDPVDQDIDSPFSTDEAMSDD